MQSPTCLILQLYTHPIQPYWMDGSHDWGCYSWKQTNFQTRWEWSGVTCASASICPGLCGTFCFVCLACQVAADMNECCLCGTSVAMRTLYRTRYGIPVSLLQHCVIRICTRLQNNCSKLGSHLMVSLTWIWSVGVSWHVQPCIQLLWQQIL